LEVNSIEISTFLKKIYHYCEGGTNKGDFFTNCFNAAGSTYYWGATTDYQRKIFNGIKPITKNIRESFSNFDLKELSAFFTSAVSNHKVRDLMKEFAIPIDAEMKKDALSMALAEQFQRIILSKTEADDVVVVAYQKYLEEPTFSRKQPTSPLYPGDSAYVLNFEPQRYYSVSIYEKFKHTWAIRNTGNQTWRGRKLVFVNHATVRPRSDMSIIDIPDVAPGKDIKISTSFDTRGVEGTFECIWELQDCDGNNCFPGSKKLFDITINTYFLSQE